MRRHECYVFGMIKSALYLGDEKDRSFNKITSHNFLKHNNLNSYLAASPERRIFTPESRGEFKFHGAR